MAHGKPGAFGEFGQLAVGLAEELDNEPRQADADGENADQQARPVPGVGLPEQQQHDHGQHRAFQHRLVKLARMARERAGIGKYHRPAHALARDPAPQLAVDEIGEPAEQHAERHADGEVIAHPQERKPAAPGHPGDRQDCASEAAVEAHAAVPQLEQLKRLQPQFGCVESRVAQPPAEDDAKSAVEKQIVAMPLRQRRARRLDHPQHVPIGQDDPGEIGEAVPPQGKHAEIDTAGEPQIDPIDRLRSGQE